MTTEHSAIADPSIHEPKGVAAANANEVYVADGAGSGTHTEFFNINKIYLQVTMADISTASSVWVVAPLAGNVTKIWSVIDGATITDDALIDPQIATVSITDGGITITQSGSAAGDVDSATPTALNAVTAGQAIELATNGASGNTVIATFTIEITLT